ncbi:MAG: DUF350 domain-containing protein [Desulfurobacteriaceae bacterium]
MVEIIATALKETVINSVYLLAFVFFAFLTIEFYRLFFRLGHSETENLIRGALIFALAVATSPLYTGESYGLLLDLFYIGIYSLIALFLMALGHVINDYVIFHKVKNLLEIKNGNLSLAVVETANLIATGIVVETVINNYFSPEIDQVGLILKLLGIFFLVQLLLTFSIYLYERLYELKGINLRELIYKGNISAGINLSSLYIITSFLITSVFSPEKSLTAMVMLTLIYFIFSVILLLIFKILIDLLILRETTIKRIIQDDNYFRALFIEMAMISVVFIYQFIA